MKLQFITLFFLLTYASIFGQSIQELENDLSWRSISEKGGDKIDKAWALQSKDPFNISAIGYILRYYEDRKIDSISFFFDDLLKKFPDSIEPYLLRADLLSFEIKRSHDSLFITKQLEYFYKAYKIDNTNIDVNYKLAKLYYHDFIDPFYYTIREIQVIDKVKSDSAYTMTDTLRRKNLSVFIHPEDSALFYFHNLEILSELYKGFLFFPIKQIETYKNISSGKMLDSLMGISDNCYFPSWYFVNLSAKWENNLTIDYLSQIESSYDYIDYIKSRLEVMKEPCLYLMNLPDNMEIYRFTWLRTFDNPISIRVEKCGDKIQLYYKKSNGNGLGSVKKLIKSKKRKLTLSEWNFFKELLNKAEFEKLPKRRNVLMCDGASWILEKKTTEKFKIFETNEPQGFFKDACLYLISLSKMKIKKEEIY